VGVVHHHDDVLARVQNPIGFAEFVDRRDDHLADVLRQQRLQFVAATRAAALPRPTGSFRVGIG